MKTKVLFVVNSLQGGGAERVVSTLGNCLNREIFTVVIVCLARAPMVYSVSDRVKVVSLVSRKEPETIFYRVWYATLTFVGLLSVIWKEKPACAISFMTSANLWTGITCRLLRVPYFVSERITPDYTIHQFNALFKWLSFKIYSRSEAIVIPARKMEECFKKYKRFNSVRNFRTINNPVSTFRTESRDLVHTRKFILSVGRLHPQKGFDKLIEAFSLLQPIDVDLLISGEGAERERLQKQINRLNLRDKVKLIGFKNNIQDYYQQAEMFVLSSKNEGYPNALVEAMSFGCACVSTDCEFGPSEIITDNENGLLVTVGDTEGMAQAISMILGDSRLKQKFSENAKKINETNSLAAISAKWENLILSHV